MRGAHPRTAFRLAKPSAGEAFGCESHDAHRMTRITRHRNNVSLAREPYAALGVTSRQRTDLV
jgi:hypothetical protein